MMLLFETYDVKLLINHQYTTVSGAPIQLNTFFLSFKHLYIIHSSVTLRCQGMSGRMVLCSESIPVTHIFQEDFTP